MLTKVNQSYWKTIAWSDYMQEKQRYSEIETQLYLQNGKKLLRCVTVGKVNKKSFTGKTCLTSSCKYELACS